MSVKRPSSIGLNRTVKNRLFNRIFNAAVYLALLLISSLGCTKKEALTQELNLAIWGNYMAPETAQEFTQKTGIKLNISNYSSNEELLAKIQAGGSNIDVAVPSDYMVEIMVKSNLLLPIEADRIENRGLLFEDLVNQAFDPGNKFSYPYSWTTSGIAYNKKLLPNGIKDWKSLFEDKALEGKVSLMDDVREVLGAALKMHGYSVNTTNAVELKKAKDSITALKPRVKMFTSDTIDALVNKEVLVAHAYSSDSLIAAAESKGEIEFVLPTEGSTRAIDNLVIFKGSNRVEAAHTLINYLLSPEANAKFVKTVYGGPVFRTTIDLLPLSFKENKTLFPAAEAVAKLERIQDLGDKTEMYDQIWTDLKVK
jgi:spermidine/putrescine transport system substrate-binding protein